MMEKSTLPNSLVVEVIDEWLGISHVLLIS
jgi:hypothetical protein